MNESDVVEHFLVIKPSPPVIVVEYGEWTLVFDKEMMFSLLTEHETDAAFRAYAGFKIKLSPEAVEVVEGFVSKGAWD